MQIAKAGSKHLNTHEGDLERFTGRVLIQNLVQGMVEGDVRALRVSFDPGAHTHWHRHREGQILVIESGAGRTGSAGQKFDGVQRDFCELHPGDVLLAAPGEWHWHGAAPEQAMTHMATSVIRSVEATKRHYDEDWGRRVTPDEYAGNSASS